MWDTINWNSDTPLGPNIHPDIRIRKTGDGVLMYPGNHNGTRLGQGSPMDVAIDGPIPSYRLKMIRAGLQDWAMFKLADQLELTEYVRSEIGRAYSQLGGCPVMWPCSAVDRQFYWKWDDELISEIRHNIVQAIVDSKHHQVYLPLVFKGATSVIIAPAINDWSCRAP